MGEAASTSSMATAAFAHQATPARTVKQTSLTASKDRKEQFIFTDLFSLSLPLGTRTAGTRVSLHLSSSFCFLL